MELHFIKYCALVIIILITVVLASSSVLSTNNNKLFGLVSNSQPSSSAISHMIFVSSKTKTSGKTTLASTRSSSNSTGDKVVMINFDDGYKSQFLYAKPILDRYGFKASFFIVCGKVATKPYWMNWQDVAALQRDGMDIESHTMTHAHLPNLLSSPSRLNYEIGDSKQCLANHGVNATIFGYPLNLGSDNPTIVNIVSKYYNLGRSGTDPLMFLNCNESTKHPQPDCRTYLADGNLTLANRYDIRAAGFYHIKNNHNFSPPEMFQVFLHIVNGQIPYNSNGKINAVPVIVYHNLTTSIQDYTLPNHASSTTVDLFAQEMKYLHDNGFKVLLLNQFGFDPIRNIFFIKNSPTPPIYATANTNANTTQIPLPLFWK